MSSVGRMELAIQLEKGICVALMFAIVCGLLALLRQRMLQCYEVAALPDEEAIPHEEAAQQGIQVLFDVPGHGMNSVWFAPDSPWGLEFMRTDLLKVVHVEAGSQGEEFGVRPGWRLSKINGESLEDQDLDCVLSKTSGKFVVRYDVPGFGVRHAEFSQAPPGIDYWHPATGAWTC